MWSLGIMLYSLKTGEHPFGTSETEITMRTNLSNFERLSEEKLSGLGE